MHIYNIIAINEYHKYQLQINSFYFIHSIIINEDIRMNMRLSIFGYIFHISSPTSSWAVKQNRYKGVCFLQNNQKKIEIILYDCNKSFLTIQNLQQLVHSAGRVLKVLENFAPTYSNFEMLSKKSLLCISVCCFIVVMPHWSTPL